MASAAEERPKENDGEASGEGERMVMYKLKHIEFLGRTTPIILQNENGPCPLLAICNVLLLRNVMHLNPDAGEVSQDHLLHMVADRLLESNSDVKSKGEEYVQNQQQNISDAIDLLPQLATGIDVNVLFRKINDFEFTRECAIFDLLDIGLYHGWIVDPEDKDTAEAIGSKSYNTLVGEIVALPALMSEKEQVAQPDEDSVDFVAATTAALGVPSPCISRGRSFGEPPVSIMHEKVRRRGDMEEEEEILRVLQLSASEAVANSEHKSLPSETMYDGLTSVSVPPDGGTSSEKSGMTNLEHFDRKITDKSDSPHPSKLLLPHESDDMLLDFSADVAYSGVIKEKNTHSPASGVSDLSVSKGFDDSYNSNKVDTTDFSAKQQNASLVPSISSDLASCFINKDQANASLEEESVQQIKEPISISATKPDHDASFGDLTIFSTQAVSKMHIDTSDGGRCSLNTPEGVCSSLAGSEPIYEGEECVLDTGHQGYRNQEPVYEGEVVLAEQAVKGGKSATYLDSGDETTAERNDKCSFSSRDVWLIRTFLENNKSQLTVYGLFRLQEGLKERELCVFFRNNHFSTMFKFRGELYLLATDQGYINQPDLVWEKLNEVNGNTIFMTSSFEEFKMGNQASDSWNQENVMTTTADYLDTLKGSAAEGSTLNSDLQLAMALQEQEFEQQTPSPPPQNTRITQQPSAGSRQRIITGPQVPSRPPPSKESKPKDKCVVM